VSDRVRERALAETRPGATPTSVEPLGRGNRKRTELVRFATAAPVVVQRSATPAATRTEAALLSAIGDRTAVPVPRPLGAGVVDGTGWLVTPLVEGRDLHEAFVELAAETRRAVARSFGRHLAALHDAFRFGACGRLGVDDAAGSVLDREVDLTVRDPAEASAWVRRFGERHVSRLPADFDGLRDRLRDALRGPVEGAADPRLFPWDFRPGNALVADGEVTAVLDWEAPLAAPPAVSVAKAEHLVADWYASGSEAASLRAAFRDGYVSVAERPAIAPAHRVAAVASAVVDGEGVVTNPRYPPVGREQAVAFHRRALERALGE
jgi:aminoglycoside phosphotransferase (APT) family kinase protein